MSKIIKSLQLLLISNEKHRRICSFISSLDLFEILGATDNVLKMPELSDLMK